MNRANPQVKVGFFWKASKERYFLKWKDPDPLSHKYLTRQTDITTRGVRAERQVAKLAEALQAELAERMRRPDGDMLWEEFCRRYKRDHLEATSEANRYKWAAARKIFEKVAAREVLGQLRMSDISPRLLVAFESQLRLDVAAGSVGSYMATLRSGLNWAASIELMRPLPRLRSRGRQEQELPAMRLEPISEESLQAMLDACPEIVGKRNAESVQDYLRALWLSGCRMREPLGIHAERRDCHRPLELAGRNPLMCWVSTQKNRRDQIAPITMDFAAHIQARLDRGGFLYVPRSEGGEIRDRTALSNLVSAIGKKAGVIAEPGTPKPHATAKHFRSSFVTRWSLRGMPLERIQKIVRHRDIATTRKYYLGSTDGACDFDEAKSLLRVAG
jgi:integrase